jgi:hypothetical protein
MTTDMYERHIVQKVLNEICQQLNSPGDRTYQEEHIESAMKLASESSGARIDRRFFDAKGPAEFFSILRDYIVPLAVIANVILTQWKNFFPQEPKSQAPIGSYPQLDNESIEQIAEAIWLDFLGRMEIGLDHDIVFAPNINLTREELLQILRQSLRRALEKIS